MGEYHEKVSRPVRVMGVTAAIIVPLSYEHRSGDSSRKVCLHDQPKH